MKAHPRSTIHYWKCDRPAAFHGTQELRPAESLIEEQLRDAMLERFAGAKIVLKPAGSQGNHLTWRAEVGGVPMFVRVENGPERDDSLAMESAVMDHVRVTGVAVPEIFAVDANWSKVPFAWQAMQLVPHPDLNQWHKQGLLDQPRIAFDIGAAVARWQQIEPHGFGPCDLSRWRSEGRLAGFHSRYEDYFFLRLDQHLGFLVGKGFITIRQGREIEDAIKAHRELLEIPRGCLVHKDLALWNILGSEDHIAAFIDFDDAISGDPMDDLALLACFHDAAFLTCAFEGYQSIRPLPWEHRRRFWLHLLRNMIVKAVIRVGAGYFERDDGFFLISTGSGGADLRQFTLQRIALAQRGLQSNADLSIL